MNKSAVAINTAWRCAKLAIHTKKLKSSLALDNIHNEQNVQTNKQRQVVGDSRGGVYKLNLQLLASTGLGTISCMYLCGLS